jgi:hypothetical protein
MFSPALTFASTGGMAKSFLKAYRATKRANAKKRSQVGFFLAEWAPRGRDPPRRGVTLLQRL